MGDSTPAWKHRHYSTMTDDNEDERNDADEHLATTTVEVEIPLDPHRSGMYAELRRDMDGDRLDELLAANLRDPANSVVTQIYDNREQIESAVAELEDARDE